ncbi:MAG: response regulator [Magnetococcales bacterium]|nr:response regulator [Magnetococcales bacterium]
MNPTFLKYLKRDLGGLSVLVIEDDWLFMKLLNKALEAVGINSIEMANDGNLGYMKAQCSPYDLIITDFDMPGYVGTEIIKKIHENRPGQVFILMTKHDAMKSVQEIFRRNSKVHLIGKSLFQDCLGGEHQARFWELFSRAGLHAKMAKL